MSGAEIAGAIAGAAPAIPALIGGGKVNRNATSFYNQPGYDPNASRFGGYAGGLRDYRDELARRRNQIDNRSAFLANYGPADQFARLGLDSRNQQGTVAQMMLARAQGQVPSIAQQQADRQMQQAVAQQGAIAASARGRAGLAGANRNAASNVANASGAISNQAQINAAMERERAEGNAFGAFSGMRQGDVQSQDLSARQAQFQAQQQQASRNANDQRAFGQEQLEGQAMGNELQARTAQQGQLAGSHSSAEQANQQSANQDARSKGLIENIGDFFSDERAKIVLSRGGGSIPSDFTSKMIFGDNGGGGWGSGGGHGSISGQGFDPYSGPAATSIEKFEFKGGKTGIDPIASLKAHSDFATRYVGDATGGTHGSNLMLDLGQAAQGIAAAPMGGAGEILSDERAKEAAFNAGRDYEGRVAESERRDIDEHGGPNSQYAREIAAAKRRVAEKTAETMARSEAMRAPRQMQSFERDRPSQQYDTPLSPEDERRFIDWKKRYAPNDSGDDYDLRGAFKAGIAPDPKSGHWPDTFKKPNHPTFSNESQYAAMAPSRAGRWNGETYVPPATITSDFTAKMPSPAPPGTPIGLSRGGSNGAPTTGDPLASKMIFEPSRGWFDPASDAAAIDRQAADDAFEDFARDTVGEDDRRRETSAFAERGNAMDPMHQWEKSFGSSEAAKTQAAFDARNQTPFGSAPKDTNALEAAKIRATFDKGEEPSMTDMFTSSLNRFAEADARQKRRAAGGADFGSDFTTKEALDRPGGYESEENMGEEDFAIEAKKLKPSRSPVAQANRTMVGQPYVYKPQFTPPDQKPGELNYGFMAQNLRQSPVTATAVKTDPQGMERVDALKLLRVLGASVADLQRQEDETRMVLAKGGKKRAA